jgi:hypothetical protein
MRLSSSLVAVALLSLLTGCAGIGKPLSHPPRASGDDMDDGIEDDEPGTDPFAVEGTLRVEQLPLLKGPQPSLADVALAAPPAGLPPPPAACEALAKHPVGKGPCADLPTAKAKLDAALALSDATKRDQALAEAESCTALPSGLVRSLRAEVAPPECADALVGPFFASKPEKVPGAIQHALVGQAIAARLRRSVAPPPAIEPPLTRERVQEFHKGPLKTWLEEQAAAIQSLAAQGAQLGSYGKGVVATEAGTADLRLVEAVRKVPIPDDLAKDKELADAYYSALDEAMEPRKARGRDGALVGLREMAFTGVLVDRRTTESRALLSSLYGGKRVDALDPMQLPTLADAPTATIDQRLAGRLPTFHAGFVLAPESALDEAMLRALIERGVPLPVRATLKEKMATLSPAVHSLAARARVGLGIRTWRATDFDEAIAHLQAISEADRRPEHRMLLALCLAMRRGPEDTVELMKAGGATPTKFGDDRALDVVANESGSLSGLAAFDAALVRELAAPRGAPAAYFLDVASRWRKAARLARDASAKTMAEDRASAMEALASELR